MEVDIKMITNPTQRQLDTRHKLDTVIVLNKSKTQRFIEHILDKLTGNVPNYVMYNNKQYESNELIIYTKEEVASMYSTKIKCTIGNRDKWEKNMVLQQSCIYLNPTGRRPPRLISTG